MKLFDTIIFTLALVSFIIAVHQTFLHGIGQSYWIFMLSTAFILTLRLRKAKTAPQEKSTLITQQKGTRKGKK